ncbi:alcohol dehydrogenase [Pseudoclavibacter endophyticus]|uniref:Alcohol dehydrogenase catalytic domain-containing protein n=1 Tax=Pseudoclavibacter endophyticus TaxID=1778590 RepID=A0A6H9WPJ4_9MICO|nr:alcohol dehydrogenase catalytic domain-containing protein [Pseudoclavibacter endophyticus]KAB1649671.1 alcohol dehydrogenase catalytic domain-containing protein [Pseudoclavibacter endophyticus]GGA60744.1 alcohol dehydrogenase [Pseudoclavibacter endophyticus]
MTTMVRAAVQTAPRMIEMREFPRPTTGAEDGLLRVEANGICGSDVEIFRGAMAEGRRPAFIPGHEPVGIIEEIGDTAAERWGVEVGDRVALEVIVPCRACNDCLTGRYQACTFRKYGHGVTGIDAEPSLWGGFAEHMYLSPTSVVHKIDKSLPIEVASLYNAMGAGVRWAVDLGEVGLGDTLLVLGAGQRGIAAVVAAKAAGARRVIITGLARDRHKLALAEELGADHTIVVDGDEGRDVVEAVTEFTDGALADVALEVTPMAKQPITDALNAVRFGGRVVLAGLKGGAEVPLVTDRIIQRSLTVRGAFGVDSAGQQKAISLIESGRFPLEKMHTHTFGLDEVALAIDTLSGDAGDGRAIGVSVNPNAA